MSQRHYRLNRHFRSSPVSPGRVDRVGGWFALQAQQLCATKELVHGDPILSVSAQSSPGSNNWQTALPLSTVNSYRKSLCIRKAVVRQVANPLTRTLVSQACPFVRVFFRQNCAMECSRISSHSKCREGRPPRPAMHRSTKIASKVDMKIHMRAHPSLHPSRR